MSGFRVVLAGWSNGGADGYNDNGDLRSYAKAAGVALTYPTKAEAEQAARKIEATPDAEGVAPKCAVEGA